MESAATNTSNSSINGTLPTPTTMGGLAISTSALFLMAILPIYFGALKSAVTHAKQRSKKEKGDVITSRNAATFPLVASCVLFALFYAYKILPIDYINLVVRGYFSLLGTVSFFHATAAFIKSLLPVNVPNARYTFELTRRIPDKQENQETTWVVTNHDDFEFETKDFFAIGVAVAVGIWYCSTQHWIPNNIFGLSFAISAIEMLQLNKFVNGCVLLGGLFIYDIFWVFGTTVMVSVAKSFDAPIKVVFPRDFFVNGFFSKELAMLGLGDIVIPGIYVAMLLRFDISLKRRGNRTYFHTGFIAYIVGLLITFVVMNVFKHAQPALLYLVPTCIGFPTILALLQGDLGAMFKYEDVPEEELKDSIDTKASNQKVD